MSILDLQAAIKRGTADFQLGPQADLRCGLDF
jgi:hypothetical protein